MKNEITEKQAKEKSLENEVSGKGIDIDSDF